MTKTQAGHVAKPWKWLAYAGLGGVVIAGLLAMALVLLSVTDPANTSAAGYLPLAWSATAVLMVILLLGLVVRRVQIDVIPGFPWIVGFSSFFASFIPWWGLSGGNPDLGTLIYRGLKVPQGIMQFWDLSLVMLSVDCSRWGFDVYVDNNGCMQDASIYAPGMTWLEYVPFNLFSQANVAFLGVAMMFVTSAMLFWLARQSSGFGQIALLIAAFGAPWLLLLERGNIDAVILWSVVIAVFLVRRWSSTQSSGALWPWIVAALLFWLMGTWKYYPFALGAMLLPVLRLHRGWIVIAGYAAATVAFMVATWENFRFSSSSNSAMIDYGDYVVLGRVPVVARMLGTEVGSSSLQLGDLLLFGLALLAAIWGVGVALLLRKNQQWLAMLALGGSLLYLVSVLVAGFGWGYKAVFLLLAIPLFSRLSSHRARVVAASTFGVLLLIGVQSVVVWNTVMVTTAGVIAAGFAMGLAGTLILRTVSRPKQPAKV